MNFCRDCKWLSDSARGLRRSEWGCTKAPNHEVDPVTGQTFPYLLCVVLRRQWPDECPKFEEGENCLRPRTKEMACSTITLTE